jgi:selT/selW/selH-like putative selenoprotein
VKSGGGAFEVALDGKRLFSKLAEGRFPAYQEIPALAL